MATVQAVLTTGVEYIRSIVGTLTATALTLTGNLGLGASSLITWSGRSFIRTGADGYLAVENNAAGGFEGFDFGGSGDATATRRIQKKTTGIADNTATAILTVTIPNANNAAVIKLLLMSNNGSTDAFESTRVATGTIAVARTTSANAVAVVSTIAGEAIATVAAGATHTLAYAVSAISGAAGAVNTFTITVTIDDSGNLGSSQCLVIAECLNSENGGITIA